MVFMLLSVTVSKNYTVLIISTALFYGKRRILPHSLSQNIKKIRLLHRAGRILEIIITFYHAVSLLRTQGKRDQGIMDESTLILHAKSWTTPKKIRHDRFRSPGPVMADLLCSLFHKAM
ncbi:hypothetical protein AV545_06860 [Paenibacillus jamilae]|nr:hypothetical protein AV545_06860 [Paenibacillus jamilae]